MNRVRELIKLYDGLSDNAGVFGSTLMKDIIKRAEKTIAENDTVAMLKVFKELEGCE